MSRIYTVTFENATYTTAGTDFDFVEIRPATDKPVRILAVYFANVGADVGDAAEEMIRLEWLRGHTTSGSGGATPTPTPLDGIDTAAGFGVDTMNATIASVVTPKSLHADGWNIRVPYQLVLPPELQFGCSAAETSIVLRAHTTVADDVSISGTVYVEEIS